MRSHALTATALALLALTACSSEPPKPSQSPSATASSSPTQTDEQAAQACTNAVYEQLKTQATPSTDGDKPAACAGMDDSEYLETVMAVVQQLNKDGREKLQDGIDGANGGQ